MSVMNEGDAKKTEDMRMMAIVAEGGIGIGIGHGRGIAIRVNAIVILSGTVTEMTGMITEITTVIIVTLPLIILMKVVGEAIDANVLFSFFE